MIAAVLFLIAGICKAVSDTLADHYGQSIFANRNYWWNKGTSWVYKWKGGNPEKGEAFPGSTTVLVWLTDGWHFFNMIQYTAIILAVVLYRPVFSWWADAILLKCVFTITFEVFYRWVLKRKYESN